VIAGDVAGIVIGDFAFLAIGIPNAQAASVFARRPSIWKLEVETPQIKSRRNAAIEG